MIIDDPPFFSKFFVNLLWVEGNLGVHPYLFNTTQTPFSFEPMDDGKKSTYHDFNQKPLNLTMISPFTFGEEIHMIQYQQTYAYIYTYIPTIFPTNHPPTPPWLATKQRYVWTSIVRYLFTLMILPDTWNVLQVAWGLKRFEKSDKGKGVGGGGGYLYYVP